MPKGEAYDKLNNLISRLGIEYNAPYFEPHVTLIGAVSGSEEDILSKTSKLALAIKPYKIELEKVDYLDEYFRCLFLRVKQTKDVMNANLEAKAIFNKQGTPDYMPHLSLMYGNFSSKTKKEIIKKIGESIPIIFQVNNANLFSTNGELKEWYKIKEFSLG